MRNRSEAEDFESVEGKAKGTVTVRDRDTMKQKRIMIEEV